MMMMMDDTIPCIVGTRELYRPYSKLDFFPHPLNLSGFQLIYTLRSTDHIKRNVCAVRGLSGKQMEAQPKDGCEIEMIRVEGLSFDSKS